MKKRIFMLLLTLCILVAAAVAAQAVGETITQPCPHCSGSNATFEPWDGTVASGHYYLSENYTGQIKPGSGVDLVLDLRGNTLNHASDRSLFVNGGTVTILDTDVDGDPATTGTISGGKSNSWGSALYVGSGQLYLYSGTVAPKSGVSGTKGGTMYVNSGTVNLYGGTIEGGTVTGTSTNGNGLGGAVYFGSGNFTLDGATIKGGNARLGGAVYVNGGKFEVKSGTIEGGSATTGGTVYINNGGFTLTNGTIGAGESGASGGTLFCYAGTLNLNGGTIEAGTIGSGKSGRAVFAYKGGTVCNVNIGSVNIPDKGKNSVSIGGNVSISIQDAPKIGCFIVNESSTVTVNTLTQGASICLDGNLNLAETNAQLQSYLDKGYIRAYTPGKVLQIDEETILQVDYVCPCCDAVPTWTAWAGPVETGKHYYLTGEYTSNIRINAGVSVVLDLRGQNITVNNNRAFFVYGTLDLVDTVGTGVVSSGHGTTAYNGGVFSVQDGGTVNMYGGTARCTAATASAKGCVAYVVSGGTFRLMGGVLDGNGQAVETVQTKGEFHLSGGQILGTAARLCGSVYVTDTGVFYMSGGTVSGGSSTGNTGAYAGGGDNIYVDGGRMVLTGGSVTVQDTANKGNAILVRNNGALTVTSLPEASATAFSGQIYLDSTGTLSANCGAGMFDSAGRQTWYASNADALSRYETLLRLYTNDDVVLTQDTRVDLNGYKVNVSGEYKLVGMDSSATVTAPGTGEAVFAGTVDPSLTYGGQRYISVVSEGKASFHVLVLQISKVTLRPGSTGIYYTTNIRCDYVLAPQITKYGVAVSLKETPGSNFKDSSAQSLYTEFTADGDFVSGEFTGVLVDRIMKKGNTQNTSRGEIPIYANAYITLKDGTILTGDKQKDGASYNLKDVVQMVNRIHPSLTETQVNLVKEMYTTFKDSMQRWNLHNVEAHLAGNYEVKHLKVLTLGHSLAVDANHMLTAVANAEGATDITVGTLYYSGCTLTQHVNFIEGNMAVYDLYYNNLMGAESAPAVTNNVTMAAALKADKWDVIVLQAGVFEAGLPSNFDGMASFDSNLQFVMEYVQRYCPDAKFMWNMTWACPEDTSLLNTAYTDAFDKYFGKSQTAMYEAISAVAQTKILTNENFVGVIPSATAIQNANVTLTDKDLYRDTIHANDFGRLIAAYTWYCQLTGRTLEGEIALDVIPEALRLGATGGDLVLTDSQVELLIRCVNDAIANPYAISES